MQPYIVYRRPGQARGHEVFVKQAFSWGAFCFNICWAFYRRAWAVLFVASIILSLLYILWSAALFSAPFCLTIAFALSALLGFHASDCRCHVLEKGGFIMAAIILERSRGAAECVFFSRETPGS